MGPPSWSGSTATSSTTGPSPASTGHRHDHLRHDEQPLYQRNEYYSIFNSIHLIDTPGRYYFNDTRRQRHPQGLALAARGRQPEPAVGHHLDEGQAIQLLTVEVHRHPGPRIQSSPAPAQLPGHHHLRSEQYRARHHHSRQHIRRCDTCHPRHGPATGHLNQGPTPTCSSTATPSRTSEQRRHAPGRAYVTVTQQPDPAQSAATASG